MHSFRSIFIAIAPTIICAFTGMAWLSSYKTTVHFVRTIGTSHYQFTCGAGRLILIRNTNWWRVEHFAWGLEKTNGDVSPVEWPGFLEEAHWQKLGFEFAAGDYVTEYAYVGKETEFIHPFKPVKAGTMLRVTRKFKMFVVPFWPLLLSAATFPAFRIWFGMRRPSKRRSLPR